MVILWVGGWGLMVEMPYPFDSSAESVGGIDREWRWNDAFFQACTANECWTERIPFRQSNPVYLGRYSFGYSGFRVADTCIGLRPIRFWEAWQGD
jgi:hypothetical protein